MKRIKTIQQLKAEKKKLEHRRLELEKAIKYDWRDVKESLKPKNLASDAFSSFFKEKENGKAHTFLSEGLAQLVSAFTKNMVEKAESKFGKWYKN
jgi:hypothetical protein